MTLNDIDTSKFLEDPKSQSFVENMIKRSKVFDLHIAKLKQKTILTYLVLVYDKESYFRKDIKSYLERKYKAGILVGFHMSDGRFDKEVEEVLIGENEDFNRALVQYISLQYDVEYGRLVVYEHNYYKMLDTAIKKWDDKGNLKSLIEDTANDIRKLEIAIFGGEEIINTKRALYEGTAQTGLRIRPEDIVERISMNQLEDLSPWGNYNLSSANVVKFVGDKQPTNEV
jgi:hypothetical protein